MLPLAALPLAFLPGVSDVLSSPRRQLFPALGADESGTGSILLQALLGVDQQSSMGRYGGVLAEILGDPLNAVAAGGLAAAGAGSKMAKAARVANAEGELA